ALNPQLALADSNYLDIAAAGFAKVLPQFLDVNHNGWPDLLLTLQKDGGVQVRAYLHSGHPLQPYSPGSFITWQMPQLNPGDVPCFFSEGDALAMLAGRVEGRLSKYHNSGTLTAPDWQLVADNYLDISDNYKARNMRVALADLDGDGRQDLLRYDDSGELKIHADYLGENRVVSPVLLDTVSLATYHSSLGKEVIPAIGHLTGRQLPDLVMGLRSGGLVMLRNHQNDRLSGEIAVRVAVYPNPLSSGDILQVVANQPVTASVLNLQGQVLLGGVDLHANEPAGIELHGWRPGLYLLVAQNETGQRQVLRFVVLD
ncbi:MAG TPA: T9SS type A sorting domain-containing protein, partial [Flammeovirgaceae bacterium]|nr:T9SS type A sorting domain-containing protein [Flammeovirgaceae bacterium]